MARGLAITLFVSVLGRFLLAKVLLLLREHEALMRANCTINSALRRGRSVTALMFGGCSKALISSQIPNRFPEGTGGATYQQIALNQTVQVL